MWKGIDINASDVGCFLKNKQIEDTCPKGETPCEEKGTHQCCYKGESCVPKVGCVCSGIDCFFRNTKEDQLVVVPEEVEETCPKGEISCEEKGVH